MLRLKKDWKERLKKRGYVEDRWGNLKKQEDDGRIFRWKTCKRVVRHEVKWNRGQWIRRVSYLYPKDK